MELTVQLLKEFIDDAALAAVSRYVDQQMQVKRANLYRATERLLENYKALRALALAPEDYGFDPVPRSHSVTIAPPSRHGVRDRDDIAEEVRLSRMASYERTRARFEEIDAVVRHFSQRPEFIVIRMRYFGEDALGNDRDPDSEPYTFEQISEELEAIGMVRSEKTLRIWRTRLVQDMTVALFGTEGAVSLEAE